VICSGPNTRSQWPSRSAGYLAWRPEMPGRHTWDSPSESKVAVAGNDVEAQADGTADCFAGVAPKVRGSQE
jgi:hypothetical protein